MDLRTLANGYQVSQAVHVAATLGIADLLADGPRPSDDLAAEAGAHPDALYRLLRALATIGVFRELDGRRFELAPLGEQLRSDVPGSLQGWAAFAGSPTIWASWGALLHSVRTGENAFQHVHGTDVWSYRAQRPDEARLFDGAMTSLTRGIDRAILDAYNFSRFRTVVDVGGGRGALLSALLGEYPDMRGILFDQPHVVNEAELPERAQAIGGSFFEGMPEGGDAYVMKMIIHDWEDAECVRILRNIAAVLPPDGAVLVIERELGPPNENPAAKFSDLNMLVNPGGRERTEDEFATLFESAGVRYVGATPTAAGMSVFEATPA